MKENKYDNEVFFEKYLEMPRSKEGLMAAGEWHELKKMMPDFKDKRVLDLGCGFGWHCIYAVSNGARSVVGVDISKKMLEIAKSKTDSELIKYICMPMEDIDFEEDSFDVIISSLSLHYVKSFEEILSKIKKCLVKGGDFVFSVEHPVFTAEGNQEWYYDNDGNKLHWPVDNYYKEGIRRANFLVEEVIKIAKKINAKKFLDLCTGSGAIAVSLAKYIDRSFVTAVDISRKALNVAKLNARNNEVEDRITFVESDLFKNLKKEKYDMIVSNPPYIKREVLKKLDKEVQKEPHIALDGGYDGLDFYRKIINEADEYLKFHGYLCFEIGYDQKEDVEELIKEQGKYIDIYCKKDLCDNDRVIVAKLN